MSEMHGPPRRAGATNRTATPRDPGPSFDDCVLVGHEQETTGLIFDARHHSKVEAIRMAVTEWETDVECRTRYARWLSLQEVWDDGAAERWLEVWNDDNEKQLDSAPAAPPDDWEPDEDDAAWVFTDPTHPQATKVYVCVSR